MKKMSETHKEKIERKTVVKLSGVKTGRGMCESSLYPIHPDIFTETYPRTHYPSASLLLAYTYPHAIGWFASAC